MASSSPISSDSKSQHIRDAILPTDTWRRLPVVAHVTRNCHLRDQDRVGQQGAVSWADADRVGHPRRAPAGFSDRRWSGVCATADGFRPSNPKFASERSTQRSKSHVSTPAVNILQE